jgi:hypothetical protein
LTPEWGEELVSQKDVRAGTDLSLLLTRKVWNEGLWEVELLILIVMDEIVECRNIFT